MRPYLKLKLDRAKRAGVVAQVPQKKPQTNKKPNSSVILAIFQMLLTTHDMVQHPRVSVKTAKAKFSSGQTSSPLFLPHCMVNFLKYQAEALLIF
jgi:hypothetical protein